jgi:uncharacterized protein
VWFFVQERWALAALCTSAACYVHLGGFATAPVGVLVAALLLRRWKSLVAVGLTVGVLTLPYVLHFLRYREWYIGERGHVAADMAPPLVYLCALPALLVRLRHPVRNALLVAWALAPAAWLFQDPSRLVLQWTLCGAVLGGLLLDQLEERLARPALRRALVGSVVALATLFPLTVPALAVEGLWLAGRDFPRPGHWDEAKALARGSPRVQWSVNLRSPPSHDGEAMNELERLHVSPDALAAFCRDFGMVELSAFGSVLRPDFCPDSDVDLLVVFEKDRPVGLFHILRLQQRLAALLGRAVDLVPTAGLKRLIRDQVLASARPLYAA